MATDYPLSKGQSRMSRPHTKEEMREKLIDHLDHLVHYWDSIVEHETTEERLQGIVYSILVTLDGTMMGFPGFDLVPRPADDEESCARDEGINFWPNDGEGIHEDTYLKDAWSKRLRDKKRDSRRRT